MDKYKIVKVPDTVEDMTIDHLPFFMAVSEILPEGETELTMEHLTAMDPHEVADLITLFFGAEPGSFDQFEPKSNVRLLAELAHSCSTYVEKPIKPYYDIDGVRYVWQSDYSKQPTSFHRDISKADFKERPLDLMAFCYIEEGMIYNQIHPDTKAILNERRIRGEKFRDHITLGDFLDVQGFFLTSYDVFTPYLKAREAKREKMRRDGIGKSQSIT